ncbi:MAG: response regulator [Micavibrio sp.]|nr:response regulator [Micavibrio sp.]
MQPNNKEVTILVIDDDKVDVMAVRRALRASGLEGRMVVAHDGLEALQLLRDGSTVQHPYLVLLDLNMPRMNGIEFLKEARHDPVLKTAVIFVLTTSRAEEDKRRAYEHNIAGYIVKEGSVDGYINAANLLERYSSVVALP